jgi:hypothetical protein
VVEAVGSLVAYQAEVQGSVSIMHLMYVLIGAAAAHAAAEDSRFAAAFPRAATNDRRRWT